MPIRNAASGVPSPDVRCVKAVYDHEDSRKLICVIGIDLTLEQIQENIQEVRAPTRALRRCDAVDVTYAVSTLPTRAPRSVVAPAHIVGPLLFCFCAGQRVHFLETGYVALVESFSREACAAPVFVRATRANCFGYFCAMHVLSFPLSGPARGMFACCPSSA